MADADRLKKQIERYQFQLDALLDLTRSINGNTPNAELLADYEAILCGRFDVEKLALFRNKGAWTSVHAWGYDGEIAPLQDPEDQLLGHQHALLVGGEAQDFDMAVPVENEGEVVAYIVLGDHENHRGMSPIVKHMGFITTLTNVLVVAMRNRELAAERLNQVALERELELAGEMQALLVPSEVSTDAHREIGVHYQPHHHVGGDYYDVIALGNGRVALAMADVSGKGMPAAFLMSNFQAHLHALLSHSADDLEALVVELNERVFRSARGERFITLFIAIHDPAAGSVQYVNCGHNPPLFVPKKGEACFLAPGCPGMGMLEVLENVHIDDFEVKAGDALCMFTDGLVEQENTDRQEFSEERLQQLVEKRRDLAPDALNQAIVEAWEAHKGEEPPADDTALLTCRFR
jgi:sigma-B regulation protein RsbU (phosphoserine phosphatase)